MSLGDLPSFYARVTRIVTTSISMQVDVSAGREPANLPVVGVTEADLTYVAIAGKRQPQALPR